MSNSIEEVVGTAPLQFTAAIAEAVVQVGGADS